jgi:hypothetical protein
MRIPEFRKTVCAYMECACVVTGNASAVLHVLIGQQLPLIKILAKTAKTVLEAADQSAATTHAHFTQQHTCIPCRPTQFRGMRVCVKCDRESPLKIGQVFFLPLFLYSMPSCPSLLQGGLRPPLLGGTSAVPRSNRKI